MRSIVTSAGGKALMHFRVVRILALAREHRRHALSPDLLDRVQDAQLVVDENVVLGRVAPLDVVQASSLWI